MKKMKFIDLYAGIGGFRIALENLGHNCVFSAENNRDSCDVYIRNFNDNPFFDMNLLQNLSNGEIKKLIPNHDILVAGFPCQPFSSAGNKKGFKDVRGTQFHNILKIIDIKKTKYIILENVKHLTTHDNGNTWETIKTELKRRNFFIESPQIFSPTDFNIPQNRERVFILGKRNQKNNVIKKVSIDKNNNSNNIKRIKLSNKNISKEYILEKKYQIILNAWGEFVNNVIREDEKTLPVIWLDYMKNKIVIEEQFPNWKVKYIKDMHNIYIKNKKFIDQWMHKHNVELWSKRERKMEWQAGKDEYEIKNTIISFRQSGIRFKKNAIFPTLVAMVQTPIIYDDKHKKFRYITVQEAAQLQSFPKDFKFSENKNKSYKQLGNAVNVKVVEYIAKNLLK